MTEESQVYLVQARLQDWAERHGECDTQGVVEQEWTGLARAALGLPDLDYETHGPRVVPSDLLEKAELAHALRRLLDAVLPILSAYRSTEAHITADQITAAWEAFDAAS